MGLTKIDTLKEVQKLFDMYFQANSLLDNVVYAFDIDFNMSKFADFLHLHISHEMPLLADKLNDFGRLRGDRFVRGALYANDEKYADEVTALNEVLQFFLEIEKQTDIAINTAIKDNMKVWEDFLRSFQVDEQVKYTHQINKFLQGLNEYIEYGIKPSFSKDFGTYITLTPTSV